MIQYQILIIGKTVTLKYNIMLNITMWCNYIIYHTVI